MSKIHTYPELLPASILHTIPENSPIPGSTQDTCADWLQNYGSKHFSNSLFYKGPLLYSDIKPNLDTINKNCTSTKNIIKTNIFTVQVSGNEDEWHNINFKLLNINGLRQSVRLVHNPSSQQL